MNAVISPASINVATPATHKSGSGHTSVISHSNSTQISSHSTSSHVSANVPTSTRSFHSVNSLQSSTALSSPSTSDTPLSISAAASIQPVTGSYSLKSGPMNIAAVLQQTSVSNNNSPKSSPQTNAQTANVKANAIQPQTVYQPTNSQQTTPFQPVVFTDVTTEQSTQNRFISTVDRQNETPASEQPTFSNSASTTDTDETSEDAAVEQAVNAQAQQDTEVAKEQINKQIEQKQQQIEQAEAQQISELSKRDIEVKTHEQAHAAVGGSFAQSPSYEYEKGPDGRRYAVDGEVSIDVAPISGDPQATISKMQKVYAAAMAPVQPSMADIRVAAQAVQYMNEAKQALVVERQQSVMSVQDSEHLTELGNIFKQPDNSDPLASFMQKDSNSDDTLRAQTIISSGETKPIESANTASFDPNVTISSTLTANDRESGIAASRVEFQSVSAGNMNQQDNSASRYNPYQNQLSEQNTSNSKHQGFAFYV